MKSKTRASFQQLISKLLFPPGASRQEGRGCSQNQCVQSLRSFHTWGPCLCLGPSPAGLTHPSQRLHSFSRKPPTTVSGAEAAPCRPHKFSREHPSYYLWLSAGSAFCPSRGERGVWSVQALPPTLYRAASPRPVNATAES